MSTRIEIARRFEGPPGGGNGGYVAGILAEHLGGTTEVSLRAPIPIETPLEIVDGEAGTCTLQDRGQVVTEARRTELDLEVPAAPSLEEARAAGARSNVDPHPFPGCFVCGPDRTPADGLRILTGALDSGTGQACSWTPDASLPSENGQVDPRIVWAALDCPGGITAMSGATAPMVLGRMTGRVERPLAIGEECAVVGWVLRHEGRKHFTGTALFDGTGELVGCSEQIWIEVKQPPQA